MLQSPPREFAQGRCGLLMNQASVDRQWRYASQVLAGALTAGRLVKLFSPQHGMWGTEQANMRETRHGFDSQRQLPIHSLYSETRRPTAEMLHDLDCLIIDLQHVGTRVYTYVWTVVQCLQASAEAGVSVRVLDRPNPLGGRIVEGACLDPTYSSFVGMLPIPMRHGLTIGELALLSNDWLGIGADLQVQPMIGWRRSPVCGPTISSGPGRPTNTRRKSFPSIFSAAVTDCDVP
jgi:uncharacterized protein YbbC (DUF1343 family)